MRPLTEDTLGDKVVRFVIGAVLGAAAGWGFAVGVVEVREFGRLILGAAGLGGVLAVLFGNGLIEWWISHGWWRW